MNIIQLLKSKLFYFNNQTNDSEVFYVAGSQTLPPPLEAEEEEKSSIKVILDTGNFLTDPITNIPVLIVELHKLTKIIPQNISKIILRSELEDIDNEIKKRCSIIPFSSIGKNNGMIIGFRPDYIKIHTEDGEEIRKKVIVGIYENKITKNGVYSGLIGLNLLNQVSKENNVKKGMRV